MNIRFYENFAKRKNSTKIPSGSVSFHDTECKLKEDTSLENPSIILSGRFGTDTRSGNPVTLSNAMSSNVKSLTVDMLPIQDLHGYDSPWVGGGGKNKCNDTTISVGYYNANGVYDSNEHYRTSDLIPVKASTQYSTSLCAKNDKTRIGGLVVTLWDSNSNFIEQVTTSPFTTTSETAFVRVRNFQSQTDYIDNNNFLFQIEEGATYTSFAPYSNICPISGRNSLDITVNGNTETVNFGGTVYGGTCDVVNGGTSDEWGYLTLDGTQPIALKNWQPTADNVGWIYNYNLTHNEFVASTVLGNIKSDKLPTNTYSNLYNGGVGVSVYASTNYGICVRYPDTSLTTESAINAFLRNNPITICYKKATPTTINTPATSISLNKGNNTLSTSGDNMTVTYDTLSPSGDLPFNYTHAYIPKFDKYYHMSMPIILTNGQIQYDLEEDYLASHKTEIGSTVAHIAYSSTGWDKDLTDGRIAVKGTKTIYHDSQSLGFDGGCYIVGVVNNDSNGKLGALSYYRMDGANLAKLIKYMMQDSFWDKIKQYFNGKTLDFIQSCIWVPVSGSGFVGTMQTTFYVGDTAIADYSTVPETPVYITHYPVTTPVAELGSVVSLSLGSKFQDFRDNQPYSSASLYLPGVGLTDLNINDFYESNNVNVQTIFDITTGDCTYKIYDDSNQLLKTVSFNASASVSLSQVNINSAGAIAGIGGAVGGVVGLGLSAVTMNPVGMATAGVGILAGASAAVMSANQRSTSIKGTNSGRSGFYTRTASTVVVRQDTEDPDNVNYIARCGRPVGQTHAISNHSGYVQCEGASVNIAGDNSERDAINNYLNSGFYYE